MRDWRRVVCAGVVLAAQVGSAQFFGDETRDLPRFSGTWKVPRQAKVVDGRYLTVDVPADSSSPGCIATVPVDLAPFAGRVLKAVIRAKGENVVQAVGKKGFVVCGFEYVDPETKQPSYSLPDDKPSGDFDKDLSVKDFLPRSVPTGGCFRLGLWQMTGRVTFDLESLCMGVEKTASLNADYRIAYPDRVRRMPPLRGAQVSAQEISEDDFRTMREWGMTVIRYQMTRQFGEIGANRDPDDYRRFIDGKVDQLLERVLPLARKYGIKVCVCLHVTPGGRLASRELALFRERVYLDAYLETWRRIATRCRGNEDVIYGYDLMNEPVQYDGVEAGMDYWNVQRKAAELVRSIDPRTTVVVEANNWDSPENFAELPPLKMDNVIYQVHMYQPGQYTHQGLEEQPVGPVYPDPAKKWDRDYIRRQLRKVRDFQLAHDARIYVGEFSAAVWAKGADRYIEDCASVFDEYGWDWSYHAFRESPCWSVEHEGEDLRHLRPSKDNQRRRALIRCLRAAPPATQVREIAMLADENWWGVDNAFGRDMPFNSASVFSCDLRKDNYNHQSLSFLVSDKGRAVWCPEPVAVRMSNGVIRLESDGAEIVLEGSAGQDLAGAFRFASKKWFPPTGEDPDLLYFSSPQYNTWIELTYHQNEKDILAYARSMIDNGLPPGIFMIDDTWQHAYGTWDFDRRRFADPKGMVAKLHGMGFKVLLWMCPYVGMDTPDYRRIQFAKNPDDVKGWPTRGGFLLESRKKGWGGVPPAARVEWWNGVSALLDFTHPNAVAWFTEQLDRLRREYGVDGFKFDGGCVSDYCETLSADGQVRHLFANDPSASPAAQSALYGQFALRYKGSEYRNGFGFAGKPVIMRLHDKNHTWEAVRRLVPDMLAAGLVGCPFICPDMVGGGEWTAFLPGSPFSQEIFIRSAQIQALCPMMQISASPWRYLDKRHQEIFRSVVRLRQKFASKIVDLARQAAKDGEPIMRNLEYEFPGRGYGAVRDEFMMGSDLLVAPVQDQGSVSRRVTLPPGRWTADDGQVYDGPATVEVSAPIERLPYFTRSR